MKVTIIVLLLLAISAFPAHITARANNGHARYTSVKTDVPGSIKGIVRATSGANQSSLLPDARLTLTNINLPDFMLQTVTDAAGSFIFDNLPAGKYRLTVEFNDLPTATREFDVASGAILNIEVDLSVAVSEAVVVRDEEGLLSTADTTVSNIVRSEKLKTEPFREDDVNNAIGLTPGTVQDANGDSYIKGARIGQSNYTVNGADVTDPITGEAAFEIPLEAVSNIQIEETPYSAEYGNFTGGVTNVQSKGGGEKYDFSVARILPTLHNSISGKVDSFRPRVTVSGPIIKKRLYFLQSFEYRFRRDYVPDLPAPLDNIAAERVSSFTQFDYNVNENNRLKVNFAVFPQKVRFYGLNFFNPAQVTPNTKQRGYLISVSEQAIFKNTSFLSSTVSYKTADLDVYGQGSQPQTLVSDVNRGNYFADTRRTSNRLQLQETYYFAPLKFYGEHDFKIGAEYNRTHVESAFRYNSIFLRRLDNTLAARENFTAPGRSAVGFNDAAAFAQDRWTASSKLTLDLGLRYDHDGVSGANNLAPRFSFLFVPIKNSRTIVRGGIGLFYDRALPVALYFNAVPEREIINYAANGATISGRQFFTNQTANDIKSPRSLRWNVSLDQGITKSLTLRFAYLQRKTTDDLKIDQFQTGANAGVNLLNSGGAARYREVQILANYLNKRYGSWNVSYVYARSRGDLNTPETVIGDFPAFVIRPNEYGRLPFDAPHRVLAYGQFDVPFDIRIAPIFEYRTGFPFSAINDRREFVGARNQAGRFPDYLSLDAQITKGFPIPFAKKFRRFKNIEQYRLRAGAAIFNITNHNNPRDVQNNINNPNYGTFYNSLGVGVKARFDIDY